MGFEFGLESILFVGHIGKLCKLAAGIMAMEEAEKGKKAAMICSGDAGIYGMASPILATSPQYPEVEITVLPGVTAASSGGAILGAPLSHGSQRNESGNHAGECSEGKKNGQASYDDCPESGLYHFRTGERRTECRIINALVKALCKRKTEILKRHSARRYST